MRIQTNASQNRAAGIIPCAEWRLVVVKVLPEFRLEVRFQDGTRGTVDLSRLILSKTAGVFAALRDPQIFSQARIEYGAVTWPGELDLAPDAMYEAIKGTGAWTPE